MSSNEAMKGEDCTEEDTGAELDQAINDLRGVLDKDASGQLDDMPAVEQPFAAADFSMDDFTQSPSDEMPAGGIADDMSDTGASAFSMDTMDTGSVPKSAVPTTGPSGTVANRDIIMDIPIDVQILLGKTRMKVSSLMSLEEGATISLDRRIGETVDIMVNGRLIGHGEITVLEEDETRFGVRLTNIIGDNTTSDKQ